MKVLELTDVHTFYGKSHVIKGVSFSVDEGEVGALLGRNGAGKTTILRSIMGLTPAMRGTILFRDTDISRLPCYTIARKGIQLVPEDRRIFSELTVKENLTIVRSNLKRDGDFSLDKVFQLFPRLQTLQGREGKTLSGGEQQMLAIGRALMGNPEIVLLDEPYEGLAPLIKKELSSAITRIKGQITILLVEQNVRFAISVLDRGYIVDKGLIRYRGNREELSSDEEVSSAYLAI